jgi:hypothetical protein
LEVGRNEFENRVSLVLWTHSSTALRAWLFKAFSVEWECIEGRKSPKGYIEKESEGSCEFLASFLLWILMYHELFMTFRKNCDASNFDAYAINLWLDS